MAVMTPYVIRRHCIDLGILAVLLLCGVKYVLDVARQVPLIGHDETLYLTHGVNLLLTGPAAQDHSPLYVLWYYLLSMLQPQPVDLYYFNIQALGILLPLLTFVAARMLGGGRLIATALSLLLLISLGNLRTLPKVGHFVAMLSLLLLIVLLLLPQRWKLPVAGMGLFMLAFARPEFLYATILFVLITSVMLSLSREWRRLAWATLPVLLSGVSIAAVGSLPALSDGSRAIEAFGQHYAGHSSLHTNQGLHDWIHWEVVLQEDFGTVRSVPAAMLVNPSAVTAHIARNIQRLPQLTHRFVVKHSPLLFPNRWSFITIESWVLLALLAGVMIYKRKFLFPGLRARLRQHSVESAVVAVIAGIVLLICVIIYPREHYVWMAAPIVLVFVAATLPAVTLSPRVTRTMLLAMPLLVPVYTSLDYNDECAPLKMLLRLANDPDCPEGQIAGDPGRHAVYFRGSNLDYFDIWDTSDFSAAVRNESTLIIRYNTALASFLNSCVTESRGGRRISVYEGKSGKQNSAMPVPGDAAGHKREQPENGSNDAYVRLSDHEVHEYHRVRVSDREVLLIHPSIAHMPVIQRWIDSIRHCGHP
jgi:hypothetical protein